MKNIFTILIFTFLISSALVAQSDTSFVLFQNYNLGHPSNDYTAYTQVHAMPDSNFIFTGMYIEESMARPLISLQDSNFTYINHNYPEIFTSYWEWEEPSFRSLSDSTGIYLCMFNDADTSINIHQYDMELNLISEVSESLSQHPLFVIKDFTLKDSIFHIIGHFENENSDHEALYFTLDLEGEVINKYRGQDIFTREKSIFYKIQVNENTTYIYYNGDWPGTVTNEGILSISEEGQITLVHEWDFPSPHFFSFHFLDSSEYVYNSRNNSLPYPNWFAQYYEDLDEGKLWEAVDNAAAEFTSVTITDFTEKNNGNLLAYGIKENFFNPDNVEFPDLGNVINYAAAYITELDRETGEREWEYMYLNYNKNGEIDHSIIYDVTEINDRSIIAVGCSELDNVGDDVEPRIHAALILRLPANGCFNDDCDDLLTFTSSTNEISYSNLEQNQMSVYPNPAGEKLRIQDIDLDEVSQLKYSLWTMDGKRVQSASLSIAIDGGIDISNLTAGNYIIHVVDSKNKKTYITKFVKN